MPRKMVPKYCDCGCGNMTRGGQFIPGHDAKLLSAIVYSVGGLMELRSVIEKHNGDKIVVDFRPVKNTKITKTDKHVCPECGHQFKGGSWGGIDAHWKSKHDHIMPYSDAWELIKSGSYKRSSK